MTSNSYETDSNSGATPRLAGRTAVVTGSTSGIGAAIASALAAEGAHVLLSGRDTARGYDMATRIRVAGGHSDFLTVKPAGSYEGIRSFAQEAINILGGRVDILVNNAGIYPVSSTEDLADSDLDAMLAINIRAPHVLVGEIAPTMSARGGTGAIVNIGSWMAQVGSPFGAMYTATKAADEQLARSWAAEYGPRGVRVNSVAPGVTVTPGNEGARTVLDQITAGTPAGKVIQPLDIANAVVYLVSDEAAMIHGITLYIDGGISATRLN